MVGAEETDHFILYQNEAGSEIRMFENNPDNVPVFDIDTFEKREIDIGAYDGNLFTSNIDKTIYVIWTTESRVMLMTFKELRDENQIKNILEGLEYIK